MFSFLGFGKSEKKEEPVKEDSIWSFGGKMAYKKQADRSRKPKD